MHRQEPLLAFWRSPKARPSPRHIEKRVRHRLHRAARMDDSGTPTQKLPSTAICCRLRAYNRHPQQNPPRPAEGESVSGMHHEQRQRRCERGLRCKVLDCWLLSSNPRTSKWQLKTRAPMPLYATFFHLFSTELTTGKSRLPRGGWLENGRWATILVRMSGIAPVVGKRWALPQKPAIDCHLLPSQGLQPPLPAEPDRLLAGVGVARMTWTARAPHEPGVGGRCPHPNPADPALERPIRLRRGRLRRPSLLSLPRFVPYA
jgi:hypothetical protein